MTILHVSDFHYYRPWFDWLLDEAPPHDLLVISGDFLEPASAMPRRSQIEWVSSWLNDYPGPLLACSGNSDLEWDATSNRWAPAYWLRALERPNLWTDGAEVAMDRVRVRSVGWTTHPKGSAADVWVAHAAPSGSMTSTRVDGSEAGDLNLVDPVRTFAPRLILSGHVHDPASWCEERDGTVCLNPGRKVHAAFPNHILVNTDDLTCRLITAIGTSDQREDHFAPAPRGLVEAMDRVGDASSVSQHCRDVA